jgi:large conductance mechanosensitive channel
MGFFKEFKEFAMKGNVVDMAVGIVIGAAFTGIVNSLVTDVFTPMIGVIGSTADFSQYSYTLMKPGEPDVVLVKVGYGKFINAVINFIIVAFCLFLVIKVMNAAKRKQAVEPPKPETMTKDQLLLVEIRDLLKSKQA